MHNALRLDRYYVICWLVNSTTVEFPYVHLCLRWWASTHVFYILGIKTTNQHGNDQYLSISQGKTPWKLFKKGDFHGFSICSMSEVIPGDRLLAPVVFCVFFHRWRLRVLRELWEGIVHHVPGPHWRELVRGHRDGLCVMWHDEGMVVAT